MCTILRDRIFEDASISKNHKILATSEVLQKKQSEFDLSNIYSQYPTNSGKQNLWHTIKATEPVQWKVKDSYMK